MQPITETFRSAILPSVEITIYRIGLGLRHKIELEADQVSQDLFMVGQQYSALLPDKKKFTELDEQGKRDFTRINRQFEIHTMKLMAIWIKHGLANLKDDTDKSYKFEVQQFIDHGDQRLINEIYQRIRKEAGMDEDELKNSQPPTTSSEPVDGRTQTTTVPAANSSSSGDSETAVATSPI